MITVKGENLFDVRHKLGVTSPEIGISLRGLHTDYEVYICHVFDAKRSFTSPRQAIQFLRAEFLQWERRHRSEKAKLKRELKRRNKGTINRSLTVTSKGKRRATHP